jgi:CheY-like chemotaxis protein
LKLEAVEVQKLIPEMQDFLSQTIGPAISIILDIPVDIPPVKIDANQLELALMNLAVNSRDAMPNGGTLTISCRAESIDSSRLSPSLSAGDYIRVSLTDTGEGMSDETLSKATEPFFTTKGVGKGTGLGLSMVHGLTAQCGGAMTVASRVGRGTTVTLWLPTASAGELMASLSPQPPPSPLHKGRQLRILLVEDDFLVRANTALMMSDLGHVVVEASSATSALEALKQDTQIELVMTDYLMPGMNGIDLAHAIRAHDPNLPIILTTGYAEIRPPSELSFPRLPKPYTQDQLADIIDSVVKS